MRLERASAAVGGASSLLLEDYCPLSFSYDDCIAQF